MRYSGKLVFTTFVAAATILSIRASHPRSATAANVSVKSGRYSQEQILRRSAPIANALRLDNLGARRGKGSPLSYCVLPMEYGSQMGAYHPVWLADVSNASDTYQAHMVWDAKSGDLISVSQSTGHGSSSCEAIYNSADAVRKTGSWLTTLGISNEDIGWRPEQYVFHNEFVWRVIWRAPQHKIEMVLDARTGELMIAESFKPAPVHIANHLAKYVAAHTRLRGYNAVVAPLLAAAVQ